MIFRFNELVNNSTLLGILNCILVILGFCFLVKRFILWAESGEKGKKDAQVQFGGVTGVKQIIVFKLNINTKQQIDYQAYEGIPLITEDKKGVDWDSFFHEILSKGHKTIKKSEHAEEIVAKISNLGTDIKSGYMVKYIQEEGNQ